MTDSKCCNAFEITAKDKNSKLIKHLIFYFIGLLKGRKFSNKTALSFFQISLFPTTNLSMKILLHMLVYKLSLFATFTSLHSTAILCHLVFRQASKYLTLFISTLA